MAVKAIEHVRKRVLELRGVPSAALQAAAPRIEQQLRSDATTRRGNVPSYGRMGDIPIAVEVRAQSLTVNGPDWVMEKAQQKGQVRVWGEILRQEIQKAAKGDKA